MNNNDFELHCKECNITYPSYMYIANCFLCDHTYKHNDSIVCKRCSNRFLVEDIYGGNYILLCQNNGECRKKYEADFINDNYHTLVHEKKLLEQELEQLRLNKDLKNFAKGEYKGSIIVAEKTIQCGCGDCPKCANKY